MLEARRRAVVLLSGGLDSATTLAIARESGFEPFALTFRYGQRHAVEIKFAKRFARRIGVQGHSIIDINLRGFGGSALTSPIDVPKNRRPEEMSTGIPVTYVPARNTIFFSFALAFAEVIGSFDIFAGMNALDYAGYPDCRPDYIAAYEAMANLATKSVVEGSQHLRLHTPLISLSKAEIIQKGLSLGVDYSLTSSCYGPSSAGDACGQCDACVLRLHGFQQNGITDPITYLATEFMKS